MKTWFKLDIDGREVWIQSSQLECVYPNDGGDGTQDAELQLTSGQIISVPLKQWSTVCEALGLGFYEPIKPFPRTEKAKIIQAILAGSKRWAVVMKDQRFDVVAVEVGSPSFAGQSFYWCHPIASESNCFVTSAEDLFATEHVAWNDVAARCMRQASDLQEKASEAIRKSQEAICKA